VAIMNAVRVADTASRRDVSGVIASHLASTATTTSDDATAERAATTEPASA
jgi:hypothetical protein